MYSRYEEDEEEKEKNFVSDKLRWDFHNPFAYYYTSFYHRYGGNNYAIHHTNLTHDYTDESSF